MPHDPQRHHRRSIRLRGYDYALAGAYFVTICTEGHVCLFGDVVGSIMVPNRAGEVAQQAWDALPQRFTSLTLDAFVLMPNHIHGILAFVGDDAAAEGGAASSAPTGDVAGGGRTRDAPTGAMRWAEGG